MDVKLIDIAAKRKWQTDMAILINDGTKDVWLPRRFVEENDDGTFTMPEWLAIEKELV